MRVSENGLLGEKMTQMILHNTFYVTLNYKVIIKELFLNIWAFLKYF